MKTRIILFIFLTTILLFLVTIITLAQGGAPPAIPGGNPMQNPIDGGLALLAAAGGGYAIKKLRDRKE